MALAAADTSALVQEELRRFVIPGGREAFSKLVCTPQREDRTLRPPSMNLNAGAKPATTRDALRNRRGR